MPRHPAEQTVSPPLSDLCLGVRRLHLSVSLTKAARLDLRAWLLSLSTFNGRSLLYQRRWLRSLRVVLETDAAVGIGLGGVCGRRWLTGSWPPWLSEIGIGVKELVAVMAPVDV